MPSLPSSRCGASPTSNTATSVPTSPRLAAAGVGRWWSQDFKVSPHAPALTPGEKSGAVLELQLALDRIGYAIEGSGIYDPLTEAAVRAFQRHWRPAQVDGVSDGETTSLIHHRSEEHTSELQSLMRNSYAVLRLKKK